VLGVCGNCAFARSVAAAEFARSGAPLQVRAPARVRRCALHSGHRSAPQFVNTHWKHALELRRVAAEGARMNAHASSPCLQTALDCAELGWHVFPARRG